ncbi:MAG: rod shape-determining protein MreC [Legionellaceae bacterium]|nr:rod shape-determining protein MreC [Legionellaceae bacterium]
MRLIFKKDVWLGARACGFALGAILLMWLDHHSPFLHRARNQGAFIVTPVEYLVSEPAKLIKDAAVDLQTREHLQAENTRLRAQQIVLESHLQKLMALQEENAQLRELLNSSKKLGSKTLEAQVLLVSLDPSEQQLVLDKGEHSQIFPGQAVLDAYGVIGQVLDVQPFTSHVMLLTNRKSNIPVENQRTHLRSIAVGDGPVNTLSLRGVTQTTDVKVGDMMITSGLGGRFPFGYPVGKVVKVEQPAGAQFSTVILQPAAHLDSSRLVLLSWPEEDAHAH